MERFDGSTGMGAIDFVYPIGGRTRDFPVSGETKCCVLRFTTDKLRAVDKFLRFVGRFYANFVNDGLVSSFRSSISLIK